jgi:pimeloyl-ACP methyl ester carboxylesterase
MGGVVIAQTAERIPDQIGELVFVAAYVPRDGESLFDWALTDSASVLAEDGALEQQAGGALIAVADAFVIPAFCEDCDAASQAIVTANLAPEATAPLGTPVMLTSTGFGSVPRRFVRTTNDGAVSPSLQDAMIAATPMDHVDDVDSGHVPQLEATDELVAALLAP